MNNVVTRIFGSVILFVLFLIFLAVISPQWQEASNPNLYPQATINYADPNPPASTETQIVHNKASILLWFMIPGAIIAIVVIVVISSIANRRIQRQIDAPARFQKYYSEHR